MTGPQWDGYYEANDNVVQITDFYKAQMPGYGWEETMWVDGGESMGFGYYMKNNGEDAAMVMVVADAGIALWRTWE